MTTVSPSFLPGLVSIEKATIFVFLINLVILPILPNILLAPLSSTMGS